MRQLLFIVGLVGGLLAAAAASAQPAELRCF
jgi:hypothetical protein